MTLPIMFLLQAFMINNLPDDNMKQGKGSLCFLRVLSKSVTVKQPSQLNNLIMKNYL